MKEYTLEELAEFNGSGGSKVLVSYKGNVYDVSESEQWETGNHMGLHDAGEDLTDSLDVEAPHEADVFEKFPQVGTLKK